jgi:hypothetical protein
MPFSFSLSLPLPLSSSITGDSTAGCFAFFDKNGSLNLVRPPGVFPALALSVLLNGCCSEESSDPISADADDATDASSSDVTEVHRPTGTPHTNSRRAQNKLEEGDVDVDAGADVDVDVDEDVTSMMPDTGGASSFVAASGADCIKQAVMT